MATIAGWTSVQESMAHLREIGERFNAFVAAQLDELEARRAELAECERQQAQRAIAFDELLRQHAQRGQEIDQQGAQIASLLVELESAQGSLTRTRTDLDAERIQAGRLAVMVQEVDALRANCQQAQSELSTARSDHQVTRHELDRTLSELAGARSEVSAARAELDQRQAELASLSTTAGEAVSLREQLASLGRELATAQTGRDVLQSERDSAHGALEAARGELSQALVDLAVQRERAQSLEVAASDVDALREVVGLLQTELAGARTQLDQSQSQLNQTRSELDQARHEWAARDESRSTAAVRDSDLDDYRARIAQLEQERDELEHELDTIIGRAADVVESAARDRRQAAEQRATWEAGLHSLRDALSVEGSQAADGRSHAHRRGSGGKSNGPQSRTSGSPRETTVNGSARKPLQSSASDPAADPLLDAVMAQFAMLKKGATRPGAPLERVRP